MKTKVLGAVAGVLALVLVVVLWRTWVGGTTVGERAFYYDLSEQRRFVDSASIHPPFNEDCVKAVVITYGRKGDESDYQIAYLQKFTDELKALMEERDAALARGERPPAQLEDRVFLSRNTLVRRVEGGEWVPRNSPEGREITEIRSVRNEAGQYPVECSPDD